MMRIGGIIFASLFFFATNVSAYTPLGNPVGFVNDFARILSEQTRVELESKLVEFEKSTGNEIVVVTIKSLQDQESEGSRDTIETYATRLFAEWGIGKEDKDTGALLLVAVDDREVRIEVGYGLEPYLTDAGTSRIIRENIVPAFQAGDYDKGISEATNRLIGGLTGQEDLSSDRLPAGDSGFSGSSLLSEFLPFLIILLLNLIPVIIYSKSWWLGGVVGFVLGFVIFSSLITAGILALVGLIADFILSKFFGGKGPKSGGPGGMGGVWFGGLGGLGGSGRGGFGGGFGGFGGGMSGGGGASGRW